MSDNARSGPHHGSPTAASAAAKRHETGPQDTPAIPDVTGLSVLAAALAYAEAGLYVGPLRHRSKHPGSVLGPAWDSKTSRDPAVVRRWFPEGTDRGVFLHCGRSGLVVFDVDTPANLHELVAFAVDECQPPWQNTRPAHPDRRHYVFALPQGQMLGNGTGELGSGWGEVRGRNGVVVVAPSEHEDPDGLYAWGHVGPVPVLPEYLSKQLPDALGAAGAVTDTEVANFIAQHDGGDRLDLLERHVAGWQAKVAAGESRHDTMSGPLAGALKEAAAGCYSAEAAVSELEAAFTDAVTQPGHGKQGAPRSRLEASEEWEGLLSWAVGQAMAADPVETLARAAEYGATDPADDFDVVERLPPAQRWPLLDIVGLLDPDRPERTWLWEGIVPQGDQASIVAPAGVGKSLMVLALVWACLRNEGEFIGRGVTFTGKVLYVDKENSEDDWADRLRDLGVTQDEARRLLGTRFFPLSLPRMAGLDTKPGGDQLAEVLDLYGLQSGDLVVLDSTQRITEGEENSNDAMRALWANTGEELKRRGLTVIRTDNTGKDVDRGARGASGKVDDVGYSWLLKPQAGDTFTLSSSKRRSKPGEGDGDLTFRRVTDARGLLAFMQAAPRRGAPAEPEVMARVAAFLDTLPANHKGAGKNLIRTEVSGRNEKVDAALAELVELQYVSATVDGQSRLHRLVRPYAPEFGE